MLRFRILVALALVTCSVASAQEMRTFHYGDDAFVMRLSSDLVGVGLHRFEKDSVTSFLARHAAHLDGLETSLPPHEAAVFRIRSGIAAESAMVALRLDPLVRFANAIHHLGAMTNPFSRNILTNDLCLGLHGEADVTQIAEQINADVVRGFSTPGNYLLRLRDGHSRDALDVANDLREDPRIRFAHPDWLRPLGLRTTLPNDPLFGSQWHLRNTGQGGGTPGADVKAHLAWDHTMGDPSVIICVIDSGVESTHTDITQTAQGYNALCGAGPLNGDPRPTGCSNTYAGNHGTRCAGVAAADVNNSLGTTGIAGDCIIMPINLLGSGLGYGTPSMEAACFNYATTNGASIITNSWGPDGVPWPLPSLVQGAFVNATTNGRGGLGCLIFWAGGNGNELITSDGYASSIYTMAVAASTNLDTRASYSDFGPQVDFAAPSSGGTLSITCASTGSSGASTTTSGFGGTSSASPLAAGVAGLVLAIDPNLTWQAARTILRDSAVQINPSASPTAVAKTRGTPHMRMPTSSRTARRPSACLKTPMRQSNSGS